MIGKVHTKWFHDIAFGEKIELVTNNIPMR
jgi:hypothetical protein